MAREVLAGGHEPDERADRPRVLPVRLRRPERRVLGAAGLVLAGGLLAVRAASGWADAGDVPTPVVAPAPSPAVRVAPDRPTAARRLSLERAVVRSASAGPDGVLRVRAQLDGLPGTRLVQVRPEVPGSAVVLDPVPEVVPPSGAVELLLGLLPHCRDAAAGLDRAAVVGLVTRPGSSRVREVRVPLDVGRALPRLLRERCAPGAPAVLLDGLPARVVPSPRDGALRTELRVRAPGGGPVTVEDVVPGSGVTAVLITPLPLVLPPGGSEVPLQVDVRLTGCQGPPAALYALRLAGGVTVVPAFPGAVGRRLQALPGPYGCG